MPRDQKSVSEGTPRVFISSTSEDLKTYREAARDAALHAGFHPVMMEYFNAQGERVPYKACMDKVAKCDVVVVIVAHRYGWVPPDQPGPKAKRTKSITWLECEKGRKLGREVLAFLVDEEHPWPPKHIEHEQRLQELKQWLGSLGFRGTFTTAESLKTGALGALHDWFSRNQDQDRRGTKPPPKRANPAKYLAWLREQTAWIDIRGLQVGTGQAHRFPIEELYIPLTTSAGGDGGRERIALKHVRLEEALRHSKLVIVGDPGSGKTTFLRRIALELSRGNSEATTGLVLPFRAFPLLIRIAELEEHIAKCGGRSNAPIAKDSPAWLSHFLNSRSEENQWGLDAGFFEEKLRGKSTVVLLDGLDEARRAECGGRRWRGCSRRRRRPTASAGSW